MRTIKFRVFDTEKKQWVDLAFIHWQIDGFFIYVEPSGSMKHGEWILVEDDRFQINQFTGLFDKNGKEIYEGDIVHHFYCDDDGFQQAWVISQMVWQRIGFTYKRIKELEKLDFNLEETIIATEKIKVIGNIYENPELLKA